MEHITILEKLFNDTKDIKQQKALSVAIQSINILTELKNKNKRYYTIQDCMDILHTSYHEVYNTIKILNIKHKSNNCIRLNKTQFKQIVCELG